MRIANWFNEPKEMGMNQSTYLAPLIILAAVMLPSVGVASTLRFVFMDGGPARRFTAYIISFLYFFISLALVLFVRIYLVRFLLGSHGISASSLSVIDAPYALMSSLLLFRLLTKKGSGAIGKAESNDGIDFADGHDAYYQEALTEISEDRTISALWARALVDANGNRDLASSKYIKWRVQRLKEQDAETAVSSEGVDDRQILSNEDGISNKFLAVIISVLLVLIVTVGSYAYGLLIERDRSRLDDYLKKAVSEFKMSGPLMIDSATQLFAVQRTNSDELTLSFRVPDNLIYDRNEYEDFLRVNLAREKCESLESNISLGGKFIFVYYSGVRAIARLKIDDRICKRIPLKLNDPAASVFIP